MFLYRYRAVVAYDGTPYCGWQEQPQLVSVQGTLRTTLQEIFNCNVSVIGASRTDAGVHAQGQTILIRTPVMCAPDTLQALCNRRLPLSIALRNVAYAPDAFHPQHNIVSKEYVYTIYTQRPDPFVQQYGHYYFYPFDNTCMHEMLHHIIGKHNFIAFSTGPAIGDNPVCTIYSATITPLTDCSIGYTITLTGNRFLRHMVRRLVGSMLTVASYHTKYTTADFIKVLTAQNQNHTLGNAPAKGLCLKKIMYTTEL